MSNEHMENSYPKIDLIELMNGFLRSVRHLMRQGILFIVLAVGVLLFLTHRSYIPMYQASASYTVRMANPFYGSQQTYNNSTVGQMNKTFPYIISSSLLRDAVEEKLGISSMPTVTASALGNTNIFTLTVKSADPQLAYDVLNCVTEVYPSVAEFVIGTTELTLLDESGVPTVPVNSPAYISSIIKGIMAGGCLWAALALLYWFTHQTINNEEELGRVMNLVCLGRLPIVRGYGRKGQPCPIVTGGNDKFGFNESVRLLRVRTEKAMAPQNRKVVLITSTIANEGKTTVAVNLATALAQKGKKTLLIDCDLRNPSVASAIGRENTEGLSEFLRGECSPEQIFNRTEQENLYIVFGGKPVSRPEELLGNKRNSSLLLAAKRKFDYVILDTPPCALVADAAEISALADCSILAVRQSFACRRQILESIQNLGDSGKPIIGCVLNMISPKIGRGSYSYYGDYGAYGSYGKKDDQEEEIIEEALAISEEELHENEPGEE